MKLRVLPSAVVILLCLAASIHASQKEKQRPDLFTDASRSIGTLQPVSSGSWSVPEGSAQSGAPASAASLTSFHRNTLPVTFGDRFVFQVVKKAGSVFAIGEAGLIARATDLNLLTWTLANSGIPTTEHIYALEGSGTGILLAGTATGKIYRSSNSGSSWTLVYSNTAETDFINYIRTTDNANVFIAVGDAPLSMPSGTPMAFLMTTNGGASWVNMNTNITGATHPNGVRFTSTTGLLTGTATQGGKQYRGLFRTTNSGTTWSFIAVGNTPADSVTSVAAIDISATLSGRVLAVKGDSTVWKSTNGGISWRKMASLPRMGFAVGFVPNTNTAYVVGRNGMIVNVDVQNDIVQSIVTDNDQIFSAVHFASATEGFLNDDLAARRYYSTINASGFSLTAPLLNSPELSSSNKAEFSWSAVPGALAYDLEIGADINAFYRSTVYSTASLSYEIPALAPGTTYYWHVRARNLLTTGNWTNMMSLTTNSVTELKNVVPAAFPSNPTSSTDYRLVYVPSGSGVSLSSIISGSTPNDYRAFRDNAGNPPNHLDELAPSSTINYHEGFWLIKRNDFSLNTTLDSPSGASGSVTLNLKLGWNIIGNPFPVPVKWSDVQSANGLNPNNLGGMLYGYQGASGYAEAVVMQPFTGYYYFSSNGSLSIPYPFASTPEVASPVPAAAVRLSYRSTVNEDRMLIFGTDPSAAEQQDQFDLRKPPVFGEQGGIWFERPEWDAKHARFAGDFRPSFGDGQSWHFTVQHAGDEPAVLTLEQRENIPAGFEAVFINDANGMLLSPDRNGSVAVSPRGTTGSYTLVIGKKEYIRSNIGNAVPQEFGLLQNYPNPFNPSTTFRFAVAQDALVSLTVYDMLGREVARPIDRPMMSGTYEQTFHAGGLASGSYVYALRITSLQTGALLHAANRRMLLIK